MAYTLTEPQQKLIRELLKIGRWNNASEILRYGLHLVAKEVEAEHERSMEPYAAGALAYAYQKITLSERESERAMETASAGPQMGELE